VRAREVVVVGAGIVGAATARELAVRGVDVLLLDAGEVSSGTTGLGEGNVLCSDKHPGPELELSMRGLEVYDEFGDEARIRRKGALIVHPEEATWAGEAARIERLRGAGVRAELIGPEEVRELEPELQGHVFGASFFPDDLQCDPEAIARALASEVGDVRTGTRVVSVSGRGVVLDTGEAIAAGAVVLAAGAWSAALAATAGLRLPVEPRTGQLVRLGALPVRHKVVDGSYLASVASSDPGLQVTTVVETTWDGDVLVGSTRERRGFDTTVDETVTDAMVARAARLFPALTGLARVDAWSGLRPWLPDHLPAIGPSRAVEGLWAATGHEGAGVALGPVTGRLIAQAYCGEPALVELGPFDPDRFS
jgi:glycine/D-amino acid oxidase-like deaminating enzyme